MKTFSTLVLSAFILMTSCGGINTKKEKKEKSQYVLIETNYGNMKVKLYNETPLHRDNFIKLTKEGFFDSLLFHRVINHFMIQGGDPDSKGAPAGKMLGDGGPGYEIPAEFRPDLFHKKGVIAAARESDLVNPEKKSSGSQFYVVQGRVFTNEELNQIEEKINFPKRKQLVFEFIEKPENSAWKQKIDSLQKVRATMELNNTYNEISQLVDAEYQKLNLFKFSEEQRKIYTSVGGTPFLDQNYTVFGEVVEGVNIVDSIAQVKTDANDRPLKDVIMQIKTVKE